MAVCRNALVGTGRSNSCPVTWWLLWLSVEMPWLALGGPILALFAQIGLENTQGDLHMVAVVAVLAVSRNALVGTGWSNSCLVCTNRLRKHCSHLVESLYPNGCLLAENAD